MSIDLEPYDPQATEDLLVCVTCGTQHGTTDRSELSTCFICDDPRQYVPPAGQSFTTLAALRRSHKNVFAPYEIPAHQRHNYHHHQQPQDQDKQHAQLTFIQSEPRIGIGQRAILLRTPYGNVLWDCITLLDDATIAHIRALGGLAAIVISHPHFYSAHIEWARAFGCPVYLSAVDRKWLAQTSGHQVFLNETETQIPVGEEGAGTVVTAIRLGGHFPGSMVLLYDGRLLIADTFYTVPAGTANWSVDALGNSRERPEGVNSFSFLWSIPNAVPLPPDEIMRMWDILKHYDFRSTHGGFFQGDIDDPHVKQRVLKSMRIQIKAMGWHDAPFLED